MIASQTRPWGLCAAAGARDKVLCVVSDPALWPFARVLDLAMHDVSRAAGPAEDLEETLVRLGMVPVTEDRLVVPAVPGGQPAHMLNQIGRALAAAPQWPAAGPPGITWPPPVDGLSGSLDAALADRPAAAAGSTAAGILSLGNYRALLRRAAEAARPPDTAAWTARQRIVAAAVILMALGVIGPAADAGTGAITRGDLARALPVILALAALVASPMGPGFQDW